MRPGRSIHSAPGVADRHQNIAARENLGVVSSIVFVQLDVIGFDGELASQRHRIPCVHREVYDDLFDLTGISEYVSQTGATDADQIDVFADEPAKHLMSLCYHLVQV